MTTSVSMTGPSMKLRGCLGWISGDTFDPYSFGCCEQTFLLQPAAIEQSGHVFGPAIAQHGDDGMTGTELTGHAHGSSNVDTAGAPQEQTFFAQQPINVAHGIAVLYVYG